MTRIESGSLQNKEATDYRSIAARLICLARDRVDVQYVAKDIAKHMARQMFSIGSRYDELRDICWAPHDMCRDMNGSSRQFVLTHTQIQTWQETASAGKARADAQ